MPDVYETKTGLDNEPVKHKRLIYPQSKNVVLPSLYFNGLFVGSRGTGKTFMLVKIIKEFEKAGIFLKGKKVPIRTILFCPTLCGNPIYDSLDSLDEEDIIEDYNDTKLQEKLDDIKETKELIEQWKEEMKIYKKFLRDPDSLTPEEFAFLELIDFEKPENPTDYDEVPAIFMIFDDLIGTPNFNMTARKGNVVNNLCIKHRHLGINCLFTTQNLKSISKVIRNNTVFFAVFKFANAKMVFDEFYEEVSSTLTNVDFETYYNYILNDNVYNCLTIDNSKDYGKRIKKNLEAILTLEPPKMEKKRKKK